MEPVGVSPDGEAGLDFRVGSFAMPRADRCAPSDPLSHILILKVFGAYVLVAHARTAKRWKNVFTPPGRKTFSTPSGIPEGMRLLIW